MKSKNITTICQLNLTKMGTNGANVAPNLPMVEEAPTPQLLRDVGIISAVYVYRTAKDMVMPSFPMRNKDMTAQVKSI